jgi:hypothetical protein
MTDVTVHLFKSCGPRLYGLSRDRSGENLPCQDGQTWIYIRDVILAPSDQRAAIDSDEAIADIERYGYHLSAEWYPLT